MNLSMKKGLLISKNFMYSMKNTNMCDLKGIMELLQINDDVSAQVKLFSTLSAYLMSNTDSEIDLIVTNSSLYDKICNILSNCPPRKLNVIFNFLSALLYSVDEDNRRKCLTMYAKNRIRSSGCLGAMCELFTSCMMHQDAWRSLCRALAEICRNVEANQSYCTHLVPLCVQKCGQNNLEACVVLQSLLHNHARNISLFLESNGLSLFQREFLQHEACLQLLSSLVESSKLVVELISETDISQHLRDFLHMYGQQSQLGQWATIILYYVTGTKVSCEIPTGNSREVLDHKPKPKQANKSTARNADLDFSSETTRFFQNVMKEIVQCTPPNDLKYLQMPLPTQYTKTQRYKAYSEQSKFYNSFQKKIKTASQNVPRFNYCNPRNMEILSESRCSKFIRNLSFSVMQKQKSNNNYNTADKINETLGHTIYTDVNGSRKTENNESIRSRDSQNTSDISEFRPKFASTPKRQNLYKSISTERRYNSIRTSKSVQRNITRSIKERKIQRKAPKRNLKSLEQSRDGLEKKNRTLGGWFFEAINESCTTLVKTVKNIFKPKISSEETKQDSFSDKDVPSCSYSFTNYMRKRDAALNNECTKNSRVDRDDVSRQLSNSCSTCNDTIVLKQKLANDECLKQTVRKLKLGINLYGCDFKKISRQLWPQQSYMTPEVLYNLYRKLILK